MARTYVWNESQPDGSVDDISTIDNSVRKLKVEIRELINQLIGVAEATALADPVVAATDDIASLRSELTTAQADIDAIEVQNATKTIIQMISLTTAAWDPDSVVTASGTYVQMTSGSVNGNVHLPIPVGAVLTDLRVAFDLGGSTTTVELRLYKQAFNAAAVQQDATVTTSDTDIVAAANITIEEGFAYFLNLIATHAGAGTVSFYCVKATYTSASPAVRL